MAIWRERWDLATGYLLGDGTEEHERVPRRGAPVQFAVRHDTTRVEHMQQVPDGHSHGVTRVEWGCGVSEAGGAGGRW